MSLCQCGCGQATPIAKENNTRRQMVAGEPQRFLLGHNTRTGKRRDLGTRSVRKGYVYLYIPSHPRANRAGFVGEHIMVAQTALGHAFPVTVPVHHVNGNPADNRPANLVICQDHAYHKLLHRRMRVKAAGGNPNTEAICSRCGVRPISAFNSGRNGLAHDCRACAKQRAREHNGWKPWRPGGHGRPPQLETK